MTADAPPAIAPASVDANPTPDSDAAVHQADPDDEQTILSGLDPEWLAALEEAEAMEQASATGCALCHVDVGEETRDASHRREGVGCVECHGESEGHVEDENNEVPPDEVFARQDVDRLCADCHDCSRDVDIEPETAESGKVCTDCHRAHTFERTVGHR